MSCGSCKNDCKGCNDKKYVFVLVGLPGAGKSTWAKNYVQKHSDTVIISRDAVRQMLCGTYRYFPEMQDLVTNIMMASFENVWKLGKNIIIDQINKDSSTRMEVVRYIRSVVDTENTDIVFVEFLETQNNLERRMNNPRGISEREYDNIISKMRSEYYYVHPSEDFDWWIVVDGVGSEAYYRKEDGKVFELQYIE